MMNHYFTHLLLECPYWIGYPVFLTISVVFSTLIIKIVRKKFGYDVLSQHHAVAGYVFNAVGVVYAVLMAFVIYVTWTEYNTTMGYVDKEATALRNLFVIIEEFPQPEKDLLWKELRHYTKIEIEKETDALSHFRSYSGAQDSLDNLYRTIIHVDSQTLKNPEILREALDRIKAINKYRQEIISNNKTQVPKMLWVTIIIMSVMFVGFIYFFGIERFSVQACMTGCLTIITVSMLYLINILDSPFTGETRISVKSLEEIYKETAKLPTTYISLAMLNKP